ncbi:MAG: sigma-70 family RNA polymerase sigma factor [Candidatus Microthrix parvicella]|jgi:RNA polymerase sigma-B factor|uniref:Putative RNA polymerase sigma factor n=1 Tax=Candidatus Neomicrothrix parvicella RN1 TaxID=1229780 RepID=R4Z427_9ACTN|nr:MULTISPECIES: sigma-70 family RNA polymerase sigma factor [Microthrix]MBK7321038.1 sigma-70 family RNA polymerase sigma factor [Candidatus Microthrix sp.]CCM65435.1 putative RNA polymerase sigma factor [Candidatus Microthrix parvicella RN1]
MTSRASATRSERRSRAELRRADNEQLLEWWIADRADNVRAELAERYQQMAQNLAARFANRGESRDDLAQVASFGILKALDRYSPDRGGSFESYAVPTAVGEIKRHFRDHAWGSKVSRGVKDLMPRVRQAEEALTARLDRSPTVAEVAAEADLPAETVDEVLEARRMFRPNSLEGRPEGAPDPAVGDVGIQHGVDRILVEGLLDRLPDRERTILEMRFFEELNQSDIAERVGVSQMHVSRLIKRALERLATLVERNE